MDEFAEYLEVMVYGELPALNVPDQRLRYDEMAGRILDMVTDVLSKKGCDDIIDAPEFTHKMVEDLVEAGAIVVERERFAGDYYVYKPEEYKRFRHSALNSSDVFHASRRIGPRFFPDVIAGYRDELAASDRPDEPMQTDRVAPGSDRLVTFSHNQSADLEEKTNAIIREVAGKNTIDGPPGLREVIIGQLKAGLELIRMQVCRAYLLELTIIDALKFIIKRYEKEAVAAIASVLLAELVKHIGNGA